MFKFTVIEGGDGVLISFKFIKNNFSYTYDTFAFTTEYDIFQYFMNYQ